MTIFGLILSLVGLWLLWRRWPAKPLAVSDGNHRLPRATIIVPARNEAAVLPDLLASLGALDYPDYEVVLVDDRSTDGTGDVARRAGGPWLRVISGVERPTGWGGKHWACHQGAEAATGEVLLFTDADTVHRPDSLRRAVQGLTQSGAAMLSCLPYHNGTSWWERLSGPFHVLLLTITVPLSRPRPGRVYAIGQYLVFSKTGYTHIGGHAAVKDKLVEDLPLANLCLTKGLVYKVLDSATPLFSVRMYATFGDFLAGWRRNFRAGLDGSSLTAPLEIVAIIGALTGAAKSVHWTLGLASTLIGLALLARAQARLGSFSRLGALAFPFGTLLFCLATLLAVFDMTTRRPTLWKGRAYVPERG